MRWHGTLGFSNTFEEYYEGIYSQNVFEKDFYGDLESKRMLVRTATEPNGVITTSSSISILVTPYLSERYDLILYATINGVKWKVTSVDFTESKRIKLQLGERYIDKATVPSSPEGFTNEGWGGSRDRDNWWS